jgi:hypothetical protein
MPVVSALTIQKIAVTSGTFTKVLRSMCMTLESPVVAREEEGI